MKLLPCIVLLYLVTPCASILCSALRLSVPVELPMPCVGPNETFSCFESSHTGSGVTFGWGLCVATCNDELHAAYQNTDLCKDYACTTSCAPPVNGRCSDFVCTQDDDFSYSSATGNYAISALSIAIWLLSLALHN